MRVEASPFDTQHYGISIGRLVAQPDSQDGPAEITAALEAAQRAGYAVVFLRLSATDRLRDAVEALGVVPVDTLVTSRLTTRAAASPPPAAVTIEHHDRITDPDDIAAIATLTAEVMKTSHLHADQRLPVAQTRALYAAWATNDITGRAQRTIVARAGREVVSYITLLVDGRSVVIDLVAVAAAWHGKGIGSAMVASVVGWIADRDVVATVGTQADNPALALYARHGFVPTHEHVTYHLWLT
ncbi:MAG: hypothetical protein JWP01_3256 [Myxococcales bacterium]|nr:hypothetical protein [Myxococcales bacterium]